MQVHLGKSTKAITATAASSGWNSPTARSLDVDMIIVSAGIRPRDDLARHAGLAVGERGGIVVNDRLGNIRPARFSPSAKCALHGGMVYGLVAPGYEMAEIVAAQSHRRRSASLPAPTCRPS